ncbi:hypothetical protein STEG23_036841, partial [Scotinomys teguina]
MPGAIQPQPTRLQDNNSKKVRKDKACNPKKESVFSGCNEVKLTFPDNGCDSSAAEQRATDEEVSDIDKTDLSEPLFSVNQDANVEIFSQSSEFEDSIDCAFLNETYSIHCSESKLKNENLPHLYSELHPEVHQRVEAIFDILGPQGNNSTGLERSHEIPGGDYGDMQTSDMDDDSQQDYHSAEQEYISTHLPADPAKTASRSNLDVSVLRTSGCGIECVGDLEDNRVKLESGPSASLEAQKCSPHTSKSQSSDMLKEYHQPTFEKCEEQEVGLPTRKVFDDVLQRSSSPLNPQKIPQTKMFAKEVKSQTIESKDFCGSRIFQNKTLKCPENTISFPQDQAPETQLKANNTHQTSGTSTFDDSVISLCGSLRYKSLPEPGFFSPVLPRVAVTENQAEVDDSCLHHGKISATNKTGSPDVKELCPKSVPDGASCLFTLPQTLDVSRGANASSVVSTSSNTELTMKKLQPDVWQREKHSVACNTDWSCRQDRRDAQMAAVPRESGRSPVIDSLNSLKENSSELRKTSGSIDKKKHPERNLSSSSAKKELGSTLLSVLGDLEVRYMNLKEKVRKGIPLEELPPLSVETRLLTAFSDFVSGLMEEEVCGLSGANSELDNQTVPDVVDTSPSLQKTLSQMSFVSDSSHLKQDKSPMDDGFKNVDVNIDFTQLKLDDKEMKNGELLQRSKGFLIHVCGLCPSVSEADLRSHFQKYQVSDISIYDSTNYRYASLAFAKSSNAKMAVKEMNGIEINGKSVNVRLVEIPGEHTPSLLSKNGNSTSVNHLEKITNEEGTFPSSTCRLPQARPRQRESKEDSEFPPLDQGVKKNCNQIKSARLLPQTTFIPPKTLSFHSFTKIMKKLSELHPDISRAFRFIRHVLCSRELFSCVGEQHLERHVSGNVILRKQHSLSGETGSMGISWFPGPFPGDLETELCYTRFKEDMEAIGKTLWCDWGKTIGLDFAKEAWQVMK